MFKQIQLRFCRTRIWEVWYLAVEGYMYLREELCEEHQNALPTQPETFSIRKPSSPFN